MTAKLTPQEIVGFVSEAASEKKAFDIKVLDIRQVSIVSDYFIICSGGNSNQVKAIADNIDERLEEQGVFVLRKEGTREGQWILLDYGDVVVHIFREQERQYYNIERLWEGSIAVAARELEKQPADKPEA